jgi:alpha-L-rhamnosidase
MYLCYGDQRILENSYSSMTRFMNFLIDTSPGYIRCAPDYEGWQGFGDWLSMNATTPRDLIGTAFLAYDANLMAQIAGILQKPDDAARYQQLFTDVRYAFCERFLVGGRQAPVVLPSTSVQKALDEQDKVSQGTLAVADYGPIPSEVFDIHLFTPTQTAYVLALYFDLLPESLRSAAIAELVADIERRGMHLSTGFVGSPYLPFVLSQNGRLDIAYALLNQKTWPSWLYAVTQGATTIWERWDGWTEEAGFQDASMNSFNHYAYGAIGAWLYSTVAGIDLDPAHPGYKHIILHPQADGGLTHARGRLKTFYGDISSGWQINDGRFEWTVIVPPNTTATVHLPAIGSDTATMNGTPISGSMVDVCAGKYHFTMRLSE